MTDDQSTPPPGLDAYIASLAPPSTESAPEAGVPEGVDDYLGELREAKYGTTEQQIKTGLEGLAEGVITSPGYRKLSTSLGITTPEDIRGREEANSDLKTATEATGLIASSFIPGGQGSLLAKAGVAGARAIGAIEKVSFLSKVGAGAARAAFEGTLYQAGKEVGDLVIADPAAASDFSIADVGMSAVLSGLFGGAFAGAAHGLGKAAIEAAPFLQDVKEAAGAKALGFTKGQIKRLKGGQDEAKDIARTLMNAEIESGEKIFTPFAGADDMAYRVENLRRSSGDRMGKVYETLDNSGAKGINPLDLASKIDGELGQFWRSPINKGEASQLENILESVLLRGDESMSFKEAQLLKEEVKKVAYPNGKKPLDQPPRIQIAQDAYRIINKEIDAAVDAAAGASKDKSLLSDLLKAKKEYGAAKKAGVALADRVAAEQGNKLFGLTDTIAGSVLGAGVGLGPAGAAVVLKKLAEKYGATSIATAGDTYLSYLDKFASAFGKGEQAVNAASLAKSTAKGIKAANNSVKAVFDQTKNLPASVIPIAASRMKLDKLVSESTKNPERLFAINDNAPVEDYNEALAATSARAVAYLNSLKPNTDPMAPLDPKNPASKASQAAYNRALDIAQQPLVTMKFIKDGTLTAQDVGTLKVIYPNMYDQLSQRLLNEMVEAKAKKTTIPYQTKMTLSLFLGQTLDSTLSPMAIQGAQPMPQAPQGGKAPAASSVKDLDSLANSSRTPSQARGQRDQSK